MAEILSEFGHLVGLAGGNNIQATTMPTYSSVPLGTIVQYIGTTTADYINGYFYKATATGWEQHDTQPASNADNSITAFKESSPAQAAHAVDDYIRYNNVTYIVTAAIAIGDTLTIGTNIAVPTLDEGTVIYTPETGGGSVISADMVGYNNTTSELEATNTQDAIDEVVDIVADKVDKVTLATNGNLAGLNASGNLTDAGWLADKTTNNATGNPISISGLKSNQLAINPVVTLEPIQAGSGDPSPSNVRAISGYDKIEVLSCGKNLLPLSISEIKLANPIETWTGNSITLPGGATLTLLGDDNILTGIRVNGTVSEQHFVAICAPDHNSITNIVKPGIYYTVSNRVALTDNVIQGYNTTFIIRSDWHFDNAYAYFFAEAGTYDNVTYYPQLEEGQTATEFESPKINEVKLTLGQTVYGGSLNLRSGKLTVDRKIDDLSNYTWNKQEGIKYRAASIPTDAYFSPHYGEGAGIVAEQYKDGSWADIYDDGKDGIICMRALSSSDKRMVLSNSTGTIAGKFVYRLETPFTIQLTPHEISLLKDYAYVSTNGTNMSFSYKNGEIASLGDVAQVGETLNKLGNIVSAEIGKIGTYRYLGSITQVNTAFDLSSLNEYKNIAFVLRVNNYQTIDIKEFNYNMFIELGYGIYFCLYYTSSYNIFVKISKVSGQDAIMATDLSANGWNFTDIAVFGIK